jgi:hypothetical protein
VVKFSQKELVKEGMKVWKMDYKTGKNLDWERDYEMGKWLDFVRVRGLEPVMGEVTGQTVDPGMA